MQTEKNLFSAHLIKKVTPKPAYISTHFANVNKKACGYHINLWPDHLPLSEVSLKIDMMGMDSDFEKKLEILQELGEINQIYLSVPIFLVASLANNPNVPLGAILCDLSVSWDKKEKYLHFSLELKSVTVDEKYRGKAIGSILACEVSTYIQNLCEDIILYYKEKQKRLSMCFSADFFSEGGEKIYNIIADELESGIASIYGFEVEQDAGW
jgi:hypothetical protein